MLWLRTPVPKHQSKVCNFSILGNDDAQVALVIWNCLPALLKGQYLRYILDPHLWEQKQHIPPQALLVNHLHTPPLLQQEHFKCQYSLLRWSAVWIWHYYTAFLRLPLSPSWDDGRINFVAAFCIYTNRVCCQLVQPTYTQHIRLSYDRRETAFKISDINFIFAWLITKENFISCSRYKCFKSNHRYFRSWKKFLVAKNENISYQNIEQGPPT
jgi:hypothetical protein